VVENGETCSSGLRPPRTDQLQGIDSLDHAQTAAWPKVPRRAFKVTCAIQFSKSEVPLRLFLAEKADGESSLGSKRSQTAFQWATSLRGNRNICGATDPVNPRYGRALRPS
jgi:hypothetical protein